MHKLVILTFKIFSYFPSFLTANSNLEIISKTIKQNNVTIKGIRDQRWSQITDYKANYPDMYSYFTEYQKIEPKNLNSLNYYKNKKFLQVDVYRKIPYAKNYSGKKFQKSELFDIYNDWPGNYIHDGTKAGPICIQDKSNSIWKDDWFADNNEYGKEFKNEEFSLDCLSLDVYQPVMGEKEDKLLPVWIYIHGGTYQIGSSQEYDCRFLASTQNIICVVIQYRLGIYGFFTTKSYSPGYGNYGLFDQHLAIKFVYNNIEFFGGDNNDINIFGQSAGGSSVAQQLQYSARQKNPIVYTGMMESGAADSYWGMSDHWKLNWWMKATHDFLIFYNETSGYQPKNYDWSNDTQNNQQNLENYFINLDPEIYMELTTKVLTYNAFILSNKSNSTLTIACPLLALPVYDNDFVIAPAYDDDLIDWSNFSKIYGTLNAEGALIFWKGESKEELIENDILMLFFDKYSGMEGKKCYQNQKSDQEILTCLQNVSDEINYWLQNGLNAMPKEIQNWISVAISSLKLLYLDSTYGEANKTYIENNNISDLEQFLNKIGTDVGYQIGQMRDLIKFTKTYNNQRYKLFNIQKNLDNFLYRFAPQQGGLIIHVKDLWSLTCMGLIRCSSEDGTRNSVYKGTNFAYHGDDVFYLFGWVFCDDYYPCRLPCSSSITDKNAALELIDFVFRGEFVVQSDDHPGVENLIDSGVEFMAINENGIASKESGFWKGKFRLYFELLDSIYERADEVNEKKNCESSGPNFSLCLSIFHRLTDNVDLENEPEFVEYSKIVPYFENLLKRYPPDFTVDKSGTLTKILDPQNISPWKLLTSNPNKTLLPFIHIPKAAGSSFRGALKIFKKKHKNENEEDNPYLSKDGLKYCNSVFPNDYTTASHSPGCKTGHPWGGTHCRYAEINDCLEQDQANLFTFSEDFFEDFYSLDGDMRKTILAEGEENELNKRMTEKAKTLDRPISTKNYDNIKFLSQIRHPVARTLSEFYYRRPQRSDVLGKRCSSNWSKGSCYIFDQRWANRNRTFANDNTENFQKVMKDEDLQILKEWIDDKSQDNISHNRQTRSLFPENEYRNKSLGFKLTGHCANMNGALDVKATQQNFGNENYTTRTFNLNYTLAVEAIENVEKNFAYVNVLEFRELSLGLLKIIFGIYKSDDQSSELIRSEIRSSQIYKKASLKTKDLDQILFDLKFASQRQNIKKFKKRKRRRRKRATHSSDGKPLGRPSKFKTSILLSLLEKNQLDFIIWEYFRRKFEASMRFYLKI